MKSAELRAMSDEQLLLTRKDTIKHLFQLRIQSATERLETPSEIRKARKDVARINTLQRQRELDRVAALDDGQLRQELLMVEASLKSQDAPSDRRQTRRHRARLLGMLRARLESK